MQHLHFSAYLYIIMCEAFSFIYVDLGSSLNVTVFNMAFILHLSALYLIYLFLTSVGSLSATFPYLLRGERTNRGVDYLTDDKLGQGFKKRIIRKIRFYLSSMKWLEPMSDIFAFNTF